MTEEIRNLQVKRSSIELWRFLIQLIENSRSKNEANIIEWSRKSSAEFKVLDPEKVARKWGIQKNRPTMTYASLSRSLRRYYVKGLVQKVANEPYVYRFINYKDLYLINPEFVEPVNVPLCINGLYTQNSISAFQKSNMLDKRPDTASIATTNNLKSSVSSQSTSFSNKNFLHRYAPYAKPYETYTGANNENYNNYRSAPISLSPDYPSYNQNITNFPQQNMQINLNIQQSNNFLSYYVSYTNLTSYLFSNNQYSHFYFPVNDGSGAKTWFN